MYTVIMEENGDLFICNADWIRGRVFYVAEDNIAPVAIGTLSETYEDLVVRTMTQLNAMAQQFGPLPVGVVDHVVRFVIVDGHIRDVLSKHNAAMDNFPAPNDVIPESGLPEAPEDVYLEQERKDYERDEQTE